MTLDAAATRVRDEVREHADDLRSRALAVDTDPERLTPHLDAPAVQAVHRLSMPGPDGRPRRCLELVAGLLEAARGDPGVALACPGPSVAGAVVELLADPAQRDRFYAALAGGRSWAFCGITEPAVGSDALRMHTRLRPDGTGGYLADGAKRYIGNAARGTVGVVFARTGPAPLSIRAVLVAAPVAGLTAASLPTLGLRGAGVGELRLAEVPVGPEAVLGRHLPSVRGGIWGAIRAFDTMRVQVGALAVGTAQAVCDEVRHHLPAGRRRHRLAATQARLDGARQLIYRAAAEVDAGRGRGQLASVAKLEGVTLARRLTTRLPELLGPGALLDHPLLEKWRRDAQGFEFMEGTGSIQRLHIAQTYLRRPRDGAAA